MSRVKYVIEETVRYKHEITAEGTERALDEVMDHLDSCRCMFDLEMKFKDAGCTVHEIDEDESGDCAGLEYVDEIELEG